MSSTRRIYAALHRKDRLVHSQINIDEPIAGYDDSARLELCRELWAELHAEQHATPEWFAAWLARVPNFGCGCRSWANEYIKANPIDYEDMRRYGWELHNAVSRKLNKTEFAWERFCEKYPK